MLLPIDVWTRMSALTLEFHLHLYLLKFSWTLLLYSAVCHFNVFKRCKIKVFQSVSYRLDLMIRLQHTVRRCPLWVMYYSKSSSKVCWMEKKRQSMFKIADSRYLKHFLRMSYWGSIISACYNLRLALQMRSISEPKILSQWLKAKTDGEYRDWKSTNLITNINFNSHLWNDNQRIKMVDLHMISPNTYG